MKVSGKKVAENRAALVATARTLLKERGFEGAGVAEISRKAGLTQGALYGQFKSKDALAAEAVRQSLAEGAAFVQELFDKAPDVLAAYIDAYVSDAHVNDVGSGCLLAACISEVRRQDDAIATAFAGGVRRLVDMLQAALPKGTPPKRALALISGMVGSVAIARAVAAADPGLAREITAAAREELKHLALR